METEYNRTPKILIVDDVPLNVELQKTYLLSVGYEVIVAMDGQAAIDKIESEGPDLILLDIMMPKINGFEVCKKIKSNPSTQFIPVVMVTALQEVEDKIRGIEAGADDFISKPFNKMELMARVKSLLRIKFLHDELEDAKYQMEKLAATDGLTGLANHRHFKEQLIHEIDRATRHQLCLSLLMMDIDYFKFYNDNQGHPAGDEVLRRIAELIQKNLRKIDMAARYGGEEFAVILPEANSKAAIVVAEKIRYLVETTKFHKEENQPNKRLTLSIGIATIPSDTENGSDLIEVADKRLYKAKQRGRNALVYI